MRRAGWIRVTHPCAGRLPKQTPRLACVKPVASVHPEPGSNSSLYVLFLWDALKKKHLLFVWFWPDFILFGWYLILLTVRFSFLYNLYSVSLFFALLQSWKKTRPLYCYVCMECFQGSYRFTDCECVACRKRVQRYAIFLNYKTFLRVFFEGFLHKIDNTLYCNALYDKKFFNG